MSVDQETLEKSSLINWTILQELILMDSDEEGFTLSLVETFVEQAKGIFSEMDEMIEDSDHSDDQLTKLSNSGHYLKGSAAALGLIKIQEQCERIQNYGHKNDFDGGVVSVEDESNNNLWFESCKDSVAKAKVYYKDTIELLSSYFKTELLSDL